MKTKTTYFAIALTICLFLFNQARGIVISGDLTSGGVVNLPAANYEVLTGTNIYIPAGAAFTFDPGVIIYFENGAYLETGVNSTLTIGDGSGYFFETDAYMKIQGDLFVNGTSTARVLFDNSFLLPGQEWKGLIFENCNNSVVSIKHAAILNTTKTSGTTAEFLSGAMYVNNCNFNSFQIEASEFKEHEVSEYGAAVTVLNSASADNFTFLKCYFKKNNAWLKGGAIAIFGAHAEILKCQFSENTSVDGGAIFLENNLYSRIKKSSFYKNTATNGGGVMYSRNVNTVTNTELIACKFTKNEADLGGGCFAENVGPNLTFIANDNKLIENSANNYGGGFHIYNEDVSNYRLVYNDVDKNVSAGPGGGCSIIDDGQGKYETWINSMILNEATYGGAVYAIRADKMNFLKNVFEDNIADQSGGAVFLEDAFNSIEIIRNDFFGNTANSSNGGGLALDNYSVTNPLLLLHNRFDQNTANGMGGAIASLNELGGDKLFLNNIIVRNTANSDGGGVYVEKKFSFQNNTIADNTSSTSGGGIFANHKTFLIKHFNNILWNNTPDQANSTISVGGTFPSFKYSDIQGVFLSPTNISAAPIFVGAGDYHLQSASPCINTGKPMFNPVAYSTYWNSDIDGDSRIITTIDMGADETGVKHSSPYKSLSINEESEVPVNEMSFNIYPNPADDLINISIENNPKPHSTILVFDVAGNIVRQYSFEGDNVSLNTQDLAGGIYLIKINNVTKKIQIKH